MGCTSHRPLRFAVTDAQSISHIHQSALYNPANRNKRSTRQTNPAEGISAEISVIWMKTDGLRGGFDAQPPARGNKRLMWRGRGAGLGWPGGVLLTQYLLLCFEPFLSLLSPHEGQVPGRDLPHFLRWLWWAPGWAPTRGTSPPIRRRC